ncbi:hypothetical protein Tco_0903036 [Tanacetum coccineum]
MTKKMKDPECVKNKVKIAPHDYSKENYLSTSTPQKQLTPEQIFWSNDLLKMKAEALKEQTTVSRPIKALTVYSLNTPATLVPRVLPTKSQVKINIFALIQLFSEFEKTCKKRITPTGLTEGERGFEQTKECYLTKVILFFKTLKEHFEGIQKALTKEIKEMKEIFEELEAEVDQNVVDRKYDEIERKNILIIANDNLITDCLSKEVFYIATNSELIEARFTEMHDAHTIVQARCLELEAELSKLKDKIQKDDHNELVKRFSNLEVNHLNLQLKYQHLKESFGNNKSLPARDAPNFDFEIRKIKASIQGKDNTVKKLRMQISQLKETRSETDGTLDFRALDFQITQLTEKVTVLQEQNELFRVENEKVKQHYKELYDSIKITRTKHIEQTTTLLTENENLKVIRNITPDSTNMSHRGGEIDQDAEHDQVKSPLLKAEFFKMKDIVKKEVYNELSNRFSQLEKHCISLEISIQQMEESFQSNKPFDEKQVLLKPVTSQSRPNEKESAFAKPHHMIASSSSRISSKRVSFETPKEHVRPNDNVQNHNLEEAKKKTHEKTRNLLVSKSSYVSITAIPVADHSKNPRSFSESKHFVCSTCHKCVFNANHDNCITKFLKEVNSRAKVQSPKTRNNNKPVEPKSHTQKPGRQIAIGQRFSLNKSSAVHEKPNTPRSCLRWIPTGRIFKLAGLRWIPTGKMFIDSTNKVDSEPPNGSNEDITNPYECDQTLNVSAGTLNLSAGLALQRQMTFEQNGSSLVLQSFMTSVHISSGLALQQHMASVDNSSGPAAQRKERCMLQCALSSDEEKSSCI